MQGFSILQYYIILLLIGINYVKLRFWWNWTTSQATIVIYKSKNWLNLVIPIESIVYTSYDYTTWVNSYQTFIVLVIFYICQTNYVFAWS